MWLEQITANLLSNAIKFGAGKPVHVGVSELEGTIQVTVRDEGIGISETDQALLFQRFSRSDEARSYSGFGLGLWISRRLAEAMRGTLEVSSRIGEGSTFTLTLPRQRAQAA